MYSILMKKFGALFALLALACLTIGLMLTPSSCSLTPEQSQRLQALSVPATGILSAAAISQGWVQPGDVVTIQRGVAIVTSPGDGEAKLFQLAELGLDHTMRQGLVNPGDTIKLDTPATVTITAAPEVPALNEPALQLLPPGEQ